MTLSTSSCEVCQWPFVPQRRSARFCSSACRKRAQRERGQPVDSAVHACGATAERAKRLPGTVIAPCSERRGSELPTKRVTLSSTGIVPDERWPAMWRVSYADGSLSDMANRTRAKDALHALMRAVQSRRRSTAQRWAELLPRAVRAGPRHDAQHVILRGMPVAVRAAT